MHGSGSGLLDLGLRIVNLNERGGSNCSKGKADPLVLVPKWRLACGGRI